MRIIGKDNNQTENEWIKEKEELLERQKSLEGQRDKVEEQKKKNIENALKKERAKVQGKIQILNWLEIWLIAQRNILVKIKHIYISNVGV